MSGGLGRHGTERHQRRRHDDRQVRHVHAVRSAPLRHGAQKLFQKKKKKKNEKKKMEKHSVKIRFQKILGLGENFVNIENDESGVAQNPVDELKLGKTR